MSQDVLFEQTGPTAIITLNRPDKLNAWTEAMRSELIDYLEGLKVNDEIRTVILTGSGRAFCLKPGPGRDRVHEPRGSRVRGSMDRRF